MSDQLSIEKQFTHMMFCEQIKRIDLPTAKQLLTDLHALYLGQQHVMAKIAKQEFFGGVSVSIEKSEDV